MDEDAKQVAQVAFDATARAMALEVLVTRLLASQAERVPGGVAARMIDDPDSMVENIVGALPPELSGMAPLIEPYLRGYLQAAGELRDGAR